MSGPEGVTGPLGCFLSFADVTGERLKNEEVVATLETPEMGAAIVKALRDGSARSAMRFDSRDGIWHCPPCEEVAGTDVEAFRRNWMRHAWLVPIEGDNNRTAVLVDGGVDFSSSLRHRDLPDVLVKRAWTATANNTCPKCCYLTANAQPSSLLPLWPDHYTPVSIRTETTSSSGCLLL